MRKSLAFKIIVLAAMCCAFSTACSGGGMSQSVATSANTGSTSPAPESDSNDTGIAGTVTAAAAATFGSAPPQLASAGGPSLDGSSGSYPANVTFPLLMTGFQTTSAGLSPTPSDPAATLTVVSDSSSSSNAQLAIPSLGINRTITINSNVAAGDDTSQTIYGLSYVATGGWKVTPSGTKFPYSLTNTGVYVFGFETPQAAMPTGGTAVLTGDVSGTVYKTVGTEIQSSTPVSGNASISANFGSGAINGSFNQMMLFNVTKNIEEPWNGVSITANVATGSNRFSGTTAAVSAPGTPMSLSVSATGNINGAFYGPAAQQLGAVWSLSDSTGSALGTVVASH